MARQQGLVVETVTSAPVTSAPVTSAPVTSAPAIPAQLKRRAAPITPTVAVPATSLATSLAPSPVTQAQPSQRQSSQSQSSQSQLIGTAVPAELFLLIETPLPWAKPALLSEGVPEVVRQAIKPHLGKYRGLRVHLIANESTATRSTRRLLMFQRRADCPQGYAYQDIQTTSPEQMAAAIANQLTPQPTPQPTLQTEQSSLPHFSKATAQTSPRHLLVCTHGSHNACCGVKGYPLYQEAIALTQSLGLDETHIWQVSHIGGHRYAPTLIDLPQGRYYGELDERRLSILLQQQGNLAELMPCYRGWSLLPKPLQAQEKCQWVQAGWSWLAQGSWQ